MYAGQEPSKISSSQYKTFHLLHNSDFFRPKLLADSVSSDTESIDQITALYMRGIFLCFIYIASNIFLLKMLFCNWRGLKLHSFATGAWLCWMTLCDETGEHCSSVVLFGLKYRCSFALVSKFLPVSPMYIVAFPLL